MNPNQLQLPATISTRVSSSHPKRVIARIVSDGEIKKGTRLKSTKPLFDLIIEEMLDSGPAKGNWSAECYKGMNILASTCVCTEESQELPGYIADKK